MSTSGSTSFNQTRNEVILNALQIIGAYGVGRTVSPEDMSFCVSTLNQMIKAWGAKGLHLYSKEEAVLYLNSGQSEYKLGQGANATLSSDEIVSKVTNSVLSAATLLPLEYTLGMEVGDNIGVVLGTKVIHWTHITNISGLDVTIETGLPSSIPEGTSVYTYTRTLEKPLRILDCRRRYNNIDIPMTVVGYQDYQSFPVKSTGTSPNQFAYNPQNKYGSLFLWPCPDNVEERVFFTFERVLEDLNNTSDEFDMPAEWLEPVTWQLAVRLARPFGKASALNDILPLAESMYRNLLDWDVEVASVQFYPEIQGY